MVRHRMSVSNAPRSIFLSGPKNAKGGHRKMRLVTPLTAVGVFCAERTSMPGVHSALQHFLGCPDFVHARLSATHDRSPP